MKRSFNKLIYSLLKIIGPFIKVIILAVFTGTLGFILSMNITIFASLVIVKYLGITINISYQVLFTIIIVSGIVRGILRYFEQYSNHYIAFRILQILRNKIFSKISSLGIKQFEQKNKGDFISMFETDVEALEVFYAHTISPVLIAICTSLIVTIFIGIYSNFIVSIYYLIAYLIIGLLVPIVYYKCNKNIGIKQRKELVDFNSYYLDSVYGAYEIKALNKEEERKSQINLKSKKLNELSDEAENVNINFRNITNTLIVILNLLSIVLSVVLAKFNILNSLDSIVIFITMTSSFGSVLALANLGQNFSNVFSSANRVIDLLETESDLKVEGDIKEFEFDNLEFKDVSFKYDNKLVLDNFNFKVNKNDFIGIYGQSGIGKTTILKLIMHYYDTDSGYLYINGNDINKYDLNSLYENISMFSQNTYLFKDTVLNNLLIAKKDATIEEVNKALKKASIYDLVYSLKDGLNTKINDIKDNLSQGEIQRIGIARIFLRKPKLLLLDEITANIDILNESIILKSLKEYQEDMTIILISHKKSTLSVCDKLYEFKPGLGLIMEDNLFGA